MRKIILFILIVLANLSIIIAEEIVTTVDGRKIILYDDHTWADEKKNEQLSIKEIVEKYKNQLRPGITATDDDIFTACEMLSQGWKYTMPKPKSAKAGWGITDGRTTWRNGYWYNFKIKQYSHKNPTKKANGLYSGDKQNYANTWRKGGCPRTPDVYKFLLSDFGGPSY